MHDSFTSMTQLPLFLSVEELGKLLGISRAGAYELAHTEGFPVIRLGKRMVIPRDMLFEWLAHQAENS